jgi:RimJ/RimL family protein N-acetyltransferase
MAQPLFETERLRCRRLEEGDLAAMVAVYGDADAMRWVGDGRPLDEAQCRRWLDVTANNIRQRGYGMATLVAKADGRSVGFCGLVHPGGQAEAEIKYALRRDCWGFGYATEAARGMLRHGAAAHGLKRIIATTAPANTASHRVLLKAGMRRGALRRNDDGSFTQLFEWHADGG